MSDQSARYTATREITLTTRDGTWLFPPLSSAYCDDFFPLSKRSLPSEYVVRSADATLGIHSNANDTRSYPAGGTSLGGAV